MGLFGTASCGSDTVFVRGFDYGTTDEQLEQHMSQAGTITHVKWCTKGSARVTFVGEEEAERAVYELNGTTIDGNLRYIDVTMDTVGQAPTKKFKTGNGKKLSNGGDLGGQSHGQGNGQGHGQSFGHGFVGGHGDDCCAHDHGQGCPEHHDHGHGQDCCHDIGHGHGHVQDHGHDCGHDHGHDCAHDHGQDCFHEHGQDCFHDHGLDCCHDHAHDCGHDHGQAISYEGDCSGCHDHGSSDDQYGLLQNVFNSMLYQFYQNQNQQNAAGLARVFADGFDYGTTDEQLEHHMGQAGPIKSVRWVTKGSAYVVYKTKASALKAVRTLHKTTIEGNSRYMVVRLQ